VKKVWAVGCTFVVLGALILGTVVGVGEHHRTGSICGVSPPQPGAIPRLIRAAQYKSSQVRYTTPEPGGSRKNLAVLLHGLDQTGESMGSVCSALREIAPDTDVLIPDLPFHVTSTANPDVISGQLVKILDAAWMQRKYEHITLVGHSMSSIYARKLYVLGRGETEEAPFEPDLRRELGVTSGKVPRRDWAGQVNRIVLLAGMNFGWSVSHTAGLSRGMWMWAGERVGRLMAAVGRPLTAMSVHRGAPFITQLRLQWLAATPLPADLRVVQLLGTVDDIVAPTDTIDPVTGQTFIYLEVPQTTHNNVVHMDSPASAPNPRRVAFQQAIGQAEPTFGRDVPGLLRNADALRVDKEGVVSDVVFVIHGIRDEGHWTERIARRVQRRADAENASDGGKRKIEIVTAGYGYFPMLSFLRPGARQEKVEWLMNQYTAARARFPKANFSYIGHSHGTYLLAEAFERYPAVRFKHVLFAGSVVRTDYDWAPRQIEKILNIRAHDDAVVAWFPTAFEQLGWQDLGGAGFSGFKESPRPTAKAVNMPHFARGGHSAALEEEWWDAIAGFVVTGRFEPPDRIEEHQSWVRWPSRVAWLLVWSLPGAAVFLGYWVIYRWRAREWRKTIAFVAYTWLLWTVLTRV
jgi:hypothetical protein